MYVLTVLIEKNTDKLEGLYKEIIFSWLSSSPWITTWIVFEIRLRNM